MVYKTSFSENLVENLCKDAAMKENLLQPNQSFFEPESDFDKIKDFNIYFIRNNENKVIEKVNKLNQKNVVYMKKIEQRR